MTTHTLTNAQIKPQETSKEPTVVLIYIVTAQCRFSKDSLTLQQLICKSNIQIMKRLIGKGYESI